MAALEYTLSQKEGDDWPGFTAKQNVSRGQKKTPPRLLKNNSKFWSQIIGLRAEQLSNSPEYVVIAVALAKDKIAVDEDGNTYYDKNGNTIREYYDYFDENFILKEEKLSPYGKVLSTEIIDKDEKREIVLYEKEFLSWPDIAEIEMRVVGVDVNDTGTIIKYNPDRVR